MLYDAIKKLVQYGINTGITPESERIYTTNLLLDVFGESEYTEPEAEPSEWLKGISYNYLSRFNIPAELQGKYTLCVGLTDKTKNNEAAIDLAVSGNLKIGKWIFVVELEL